MVFSAELGYDPEEWEECAETEHFLALGLFTRVCLGILTVLLAFLFFWILEMNKRRGQHLAREEGKVAVEPWRPLENVGEADGEEEELSAETRLDRASQEAEQKARPERRRSSKRDLSKEEELALLAWRAEVHRMECERLQASEQPSEMGREDIGMAGEKQPQNELASGAIEIPQAETDNGLNKDQKQLQSGEFVPANVASADEEKMEEGAKLVEMEKADHRIYEEDQQKLQAQPEPIASSSIVAKSSEEIKRIAYDDDLLPADASARSNQQLLQQLQKSREMQEMPLLLLEVPRPKDLTRLHAEFLPGKTPPSTPPGGVPLAEQLPELAAHYRQMADELTQKLLEELEETDVAEEADAKAMAARHRGQIDGALQESGAPHEVRQQLARQLESHMASVVSQEMRRRSSSNLLLPKSAEDGAEQAQSAVLPRVPLDSSMPAGAKKGSSSSEEGGFVKIRAQMEAEEVVAMASGDVSPQLPSSSGPSSPPVLLVVEQRLTPSPQVVTTDEEEAETPGGRIRVSLFSSGEGEGEGGSTTADDIEFVPSARPSPLPPVHPAQQRQAQAVTEQEEVERLEANKERPIQRPSTAPQKPAEEQRRRQLEADEAEQVLALLEEYNLGGGPPTGPDAEQAEGEGERGRQFSSGAASSSKVSSSGGIISLPGSAQRTPGSSSMPETPGSLGFDFINFPSTIPAGHEATETTTALTRIEMVEQQLRAVEAGEEEMEEEGEASLERRSNVPVSDCGKEEPETVLKRAEAGATVQAVHALEQRREVGAQFHAAIDQPIAGDGKEANMDQTLEQEKAEKFLQEALEYMEEKTALRRGSGQAVSESPAVGRAQQFVVEEEMLESEEGPALPGAKKPQTPISGRRGKSSGKGGGSTTAGADGTSKQIGTNEVFDKPDPLLLFDDADDRDVTYAPEIQSMEVPPDEMSQADSLNLVEENFSEHQEAAAPAASGVGNADEPKDVLLEQRRAKREWKVGEGEEEEERFGRELTPREEAEIQRQIDRLRRTPSPRLPDQPRKPQAPQFLRNYFNSGGHSGAEELSTSSGLDSTSIRQSSLLSAVGVSSTQEMLLKLTSLEALSQAMRKAGLESSNLIFGIDYTASNKYQGERSFGGRSLHSVAEKTIENPYQQVIKIMGRTLAPFAGTDENGIPVFGFGDSSTGDWSVFPLNATPEGECSDLDDVLRVYNRVTPGIDLSGPTNFAPLIYRSMEICHRRKDYHILVIIADGQVTNERATRKAIVSACQYPLSIIVVGVGDGPWDMMKLFDESLPKRPWDNFHFVEFHALITEPREELTMQQNPELAFAVHSLLEIPDQFNTIRKLGMLLPTYYTRPQPHSPRSNSPRPQARKK